MSGYYTNLTFNEQQKVLSVIAGLKMNAGSGKAITRQEVNTAFMQAVGKPLSIEFMRDPSVVSLMSLVSPSRGSSGAFSQKGNPRLNTDPSTAITDRNMAARGLPVPKASTPALGGTRYSAGAANNSRYGR